MKTFHIQTLGCKVNHYESEQIATLLRARGLLPTDAGGADLRIVHSCSVTTQAASQSRQSVRRLVRLPLLNQPVEPGATTSITLSSPPDADAARRPRTIVTGCWATSNSAEAAALPGVDAVLGHQHDVAQELDRLLTLWQGESHSPVKEHTLSIAAPSNTLGKSVGLEFSETEFRAGQITGNIEPKSLRAVNGNPAIDSQLGVTLGCGGLRHAPSPGTPGEGWGEGLPQLMEDPHPNPLPDYRERGPESPRLKGTLSRFAVSTSPGTTALPLLGSRQPGRQRAFLKIQDGCDAHCTYCIIPKLRPTLWSKPVDAAVAEATALIVAGHVEIVLTGIFLGAYGQSTALRRRQDRPTAEALGELVDALCTRVPGLRRLRLSSLEPGDLTASLLDTLRRHRQVVPHFHLPLQSGSEHLLHRMNRQYTRDDFLNMVDRVNAAFDRPALTTDIVVGFPGETDVEFAKTAEVVRAAKFIHVHAFPYSARPGTAAARWTNQFVRGPVVNERIEHLRQIAAEQSLAFRQSFIGQRVELIVEQNSEEVSRTTDPGIRHGRCERYFMVQVHAPMARPGDSIVASIVEAKGEQTIGELDEMER